MTLNAGLIGENASIGGESAKRHPDVVVDLHNFLDGAGLLELGDGFFLRVATADTSTARMMASLPTTPTEHIPRFTASMAYSTWKRCPLGEKTVMAESYDI